MRELILSLKQDGATVIFSSHILPDAEALCDRVAILVHGTVKEIVDLGQLDGSEPTFALAVRGIDASVLEPFGAPRFTHGSGMRLVVTLNDHEQAWAAMVRVRERGGEVESLSRVLPSLEERFLRYMQGGHAD
jgi:ABC-2 type transport system ATP-binding protein